MTTLYYIILVGWLGLRTQGDGISPWARRCNLGGPMDLTLQDDRQRIQQLADTSALSHPASSQCKAHVVPP